MPVRTVETPWRMGAADYLGALRGPRLPLSGAPVEPVWDAELGAAMRHHGVAVHEESVLNELLTGLTLGSVGAPHYGQPITHDLG